MGYSNNKVTAPVSTDDVSAALGVASNDIGTLCYSDKINGWAKYKPVKTDNPINTPDSWRGDDGDCGFIVPVVTDQARKIIGSSIVFTDKYYKDSNGWIYDRPQDGDWAILDSFDGYYHKAYPPFKDADGDPNVTIYESQADAVTLPINHLLGFNNLTLQVSNFISTQELNYFGILINGSANGAAASKLIISNTTTNFFGNSFTIANPNLPVGTYLGYYLLGSQPGVYGYDDDDELTVTPLPVVAPIKFRIIENGSTAPSGEPITLSITNPNLNNQGDISVTYTIKNVSSTSVSISAIDVDIYAKSTDTTPSESFGKPLLTPITLETYNEYLGTGILTDRLEYLTSISGWDNPKIVVKVKVGLYTITKEAPLFIPAQL